MTVNSTTLANIKSITFPIYKALLTIWTVLLLLFRPSTVGELYNPYVFVGFACVSLLISIVYSPLSFRVNRRKATMLFLILITLGYFFLQGMALSTAKQTVINASALMISASILIALVLREENTNFILKVFIGFHFILSGSAIISTILLIATNFNTQVLTIARIPIYQGGHFIIPPFSEYWSLVGFFGRAIPRFVGIYREPGTSQIYFLTAFFLTFFVPISRIKLTRIVLLTGSFLLFSTAGVFNLIVGLLALYLFKDGVKNIMQKMLHAKIPRYLLALTFAVGVLTLFFLTVPSGLNPFNKLKAESGLSRIESITFGIDAWQEKPILGYGYYYGFDKTNVGDDNVNFGVTFGRGFIGLFATAYQIGIVGILLYLVMWWYGLFRMGNWQTLCIYIPVLVSLLVFQPNYNSVFVWFLLLLDTSQFKQIAYDGKK